jgi:hypothetical protein
MKQYLLFLCLVFFYQNIIQAQTIHAVLIADTNDVEIAKGSELSLSNMENLVNLLKRKKIVQQVYLYKCVGERFNKATIEQELNAVTCHPDDIILFFYAGHGFRTPQHKNKYPILSVGNDSNRDLSNKVGMVAQSVFEQLKTKKPKLLLMFIDACNDDGLSPASLSVNLIHSLGVTKPLVEERYKKLFLEATGEIIVSSSLPHTPSWVDKSSGGLFGLGLHDALTHELYEGQSAANFWQTVLNTAKNSTVAYAYSRGKVQVPQFEGIINGQKISSAMNKPENTNSNTLEKNLNSLFNGRGENYEDRKKIAAQLRSSFAAVGKDEVNVKIMSSSGVGYQTLEKYIEELLLSATKRTIVVKEAKTDEQGKVKLLIVEEK